ncbi:MAG: DNA mismatch repair endonuclease MutL [Anaerolineales bacterium]
MPIHILPDEVASAIAAGEVVERPSSVVKELVENALDASASRIEILVEGGGSTKIAIADDGMGIHPDEIELALARYATSKLSTASDLFDIRTLGFRGEALSSIAAVSRLELRSAAADESVGRRLVVEGGETKSLEPVGAPGGTVVSVRDLFFNVPARRSFLKTETTERRRINDLVTRYALAYPNVRFRLVHDGRKSFQTTGNGDRREVLAEMFGVERAQQMISVPEDSHGPIVVQGYISPPSVHRSNRRELTFFVNGRWVQDSSLSAAVLQAYHGLLMVGRYPMAVLFLETPPGSVDVNVHPAKAEVRFKDPRSVFSAVQRSVRATLLRQAPPPSVDLERSWGPSGWPSAGAQSIDPSWQMAGQLRGTDEGASPPLLPASRAEGAVPLLRTVGQVGSAYLVAEGPDGVYLIDQHAAHERILFERFMSDFREGAVESQGLLEAITVELDPSEAELLAERLPALKALGFDVEAFGGRSFRVRSMPAMLTALAPESALRTAVEDFEEDETPLEGEVEAIIAARVCKRAAIKAGQVLSLEEQRQLVRDLEECHSPRSCPHGRPTMIHLSVQSLERQFGRRG